MDTSPEEMNNLLNLSLIWDFLIYSFGLSLFILSRSFVPAGLLLDFYPPSLNHDVIFHFPVLDVFKVHML